MADLSNGHPHDYEPGQQSHLRHVHIPRSAEQPSDPDQPAATDTDIAYARDLVAELAALNQLAHTCTPRWWPHKLGDTCCCDTCGHRWHVENYPQYGQLGWQSDA